MKYSIAAAAGLFMTAALVAMPGQSIAAAKGERIQVTGEIMDTWCYLSGVMGEPDATLGTAHHTCAVWCAAGGIPVGLHTADGEIYMVLKLEGAGTADASPALLEIQTDQVTADGYVYERDGLKYLIVEKIVGNEGITNLSHEEYGLTPGFAIPKAEKKRILGQ